MHAWKIVCDFDGTIATRDVSDQLLLRFAKTGWEVFEDAWRAGRIGSRECMTGQIGLLDASREEINEALDAMPIDPMFATFVENARVAGIEVVVASDGLDYAIERILAKHGLGHLKIIANHLEQTGERDWKMTSPNAAAACRSRSGTCKCACVDTLTPPVSHYKSLLIGDGQSDFCVSERVDFVFAKDRLLTHCRDHDVPHRAIAGFADATMLLQSLIAGDLDTTPSLPSLIPLQRVDYA